MADASIVTEILGEAAPAHRKRFPHHAARGRAIPRRRDRLSGAVRPHHRRPRGRGVLFRRRRDPRLALVRARRKERRRRRCRPQGQPRAPRHRPRAPRPRRPPPRRRRRPRPLPRARARPFDRPRPAIRHRRHHRPRRRAPRHLHRHDRRRPHHLPLRPPVVASSDKTPRLARDALRRHGACAIFSSRKIDKEGCRFVMINRPKSRKGLYR